MESLSTVAFGKNALSASKTITLQKLPSVSIVAMDAKFSCAQSLDVEGRTSLLSR